MVNAKVKWGKLDYDVVIDTSSDVAAFKATLQALTGVSAERQKLMCKLWPGTLKDDAVLSAIPFKDGIAISLMGSADTVVKPAAPVVFVEDMPKGAAAVAGKGIPVGLENTGNTCYLNSKANCCRFLQVAPFTPLVSAGTVEALRFVPELKDAVGEHRGRAR
jgi:ubiquitin carboxyl-terminal hydrolase 14